MNDASNALIVFITNKAVWIPLAAWFTAQFLKVLINLLRYRKLQWSYMYTPGGMPSAHSAVMAALATTLGVMQGVESPLFAIALVVAFVVMYDAAGVRRTVGYHSTMLNRMLDELALRRHLLEAAGSQMRFARPAGGDWGCIAASA